MMIILLLLLQSPQSLLGTNAVNPAVTGRTYHYVPLTKVAASKWTHIETCGPVVYVRYMDPKRGGDGDWHVTLAIGAVKVVVEIIPAIPLPIPRNGQTIRVRGISRCDLGHGRSVNGICSWPEIHPAESIEIGCDR